MPIRNGFIELDISVYSAANRPTKLESSPCCLTFGLPAYVYPMIDTNNRAKGSLACLANRTNDSTRRTSS